MGGWDIYYSELLDGVYQKPVNIGAPLNTQFLEAAPVIAPDDSYLLYTAGGYEDSLGSEDLYVSFRSEHGWTRGLNLGATVNSTNSDKFPSISPDGKYIFFVSERYPDRTYKFTDATYDELMQRNIAGNNGLGGDVYWVSSKVIESLRPPN